MVTYKMPDKISNPAPLLAVMRDCRKALLAESLKVKPMGTVYHGLHSVVAASASSAFCESSVVSVPCGTLGSLSGLPRP